jgi:hypothetical protein
MWFMKKMNSNLKGVKGMLPYWGREGVTLATKGVSQCLDGDK